MTMKRVTAAFITLLLVSASPLPLSASSDSEHPKHEHWAFDGVFGQVDRQAAQRGFQVYKEVCASCHSMNLVHYRNLEELGFSEGEIKAIAAEKTVKDGPNDEGDMFDRPARASDHFVAPYANEKAARASNGGAFPPDLSLMIKARPDGANYVYSILTGYQDAPADFHVGENMHYNPYFPGRQIAMPAPLAEGLVTYQDGTTATVDQMAHDVVNFLQWAAEPEMEQRKRMGIKAIFFLTITAVLFFYANRRIWLDVKKGIK